MIRSKIRIGLYAGEGADPESKEHFAQFARTVLESEPAYLLAGEFQRGRLEASDLLVIPGGRGGQTCADLGHEGADRIREFVYKGGRMLGICAGLYALSSGYEWSLKMIPVSTLDRKHWRRGQGQVDLQLTRTGIDWMVEVPRPFSVKFSNGPIVEFVDPGELIFPEAEKGTHSPDTEVLATYLTELVHDKGIKGLMPGSPAILFQSYGQGKILALGPHLEESPAAFAALKSAILKLLA